MPTPLLTLIEARIVAVLMEKERTVPDTYPMSLSALVGGCNQKTARDPVMSLSDQDVLQALSTLRERDWVIETSGSRVMRYEQNANRVLQIASNGLILLAVLMLRGPQTVAELRANSQRWYVFADASSVEAYLEELANRSAGALVTKLPKQPGSREARWAHLLCGDADRAHGSLVAEAMSTPSASGTGPLAPIAAADASRIQALEDRVDQLESQLAEVRALVSNRQPEPPHQRDGDH